MLKRVGYLSDAAIAGVVYLGERLGKPVLVEGPAGTGKTELAKSVAAATGRRLIRLQCYEGLDEAKALYEWDYRKQLLRMQSRGSDGSAPTQSWKDVEGDLFSEDFLLTRPLLEAIRATEPVVLLIDEVDRLDVETEALLLEVLSDYQVSIPELGTIRPVRCRWSSSPPTAAASSPRHSSAGACSCTWTTRVWSASGRSYSAGCRRSPNTWPTRSPASSGRCVGWTSRSTHPSRRPWTGPARSY